MPICCQATVAGQPGVTGHRREVRDRRAARSFAAQRFAHFEAARAACATAVACDRARDAALRAVTRQAPRLTALRQPSSSRARQPFEIEKRVEARRRPASRPARLAVDLDRVQLEARVDTPMANAAGRRRSTRSAAAAPQAQAANAEVDAGRDQQSPRTVEPPAGRPARASGAPADQREGEQPAARRGRSPRCWPVWQDDASARVVMASIRRGSRHAFHHRGQQLVERRALRAGRRAPASHDGAGPPARSLCDVVGRDEVAPLASTRRRAPPRIERHARRASPAPNSSPGHSRAWRGPARTA